MVETVCQLGCVPLVLRVVIHPYPLKGDTYFAISWCNNDGMPWYWLSPESRSIGIGKGIKGVSGFRNAPNP